MRVKKTQPLSSQLLLIIVYGWLVTTATLSRAVSCTTVNTDDNCWSNNVISSAEAQEAAVAPCIIHAALQQSGMETSSTGTAVDIDCTNNSESSSNKNELQRQHGVYALLRRFERVSGVVLDGCYTSYNSDTSYGLELLPNCEKFSKITVERFHAEFLQQLQCAKRFNNGAEHQQLQAELLIFRNNEIASIGANAFDNLLQLRELYFTSNSLRHIESNAFAKLHVIEIIQIENEHLLAVKLEQRELFKRTSVAEIRLLALKRVTPKLFEWLPETLHTIHVERTTIADDDDQKITAASLMLSNPHMLRNITIIDCALKSFILNDQQASVLTVNLSGNALSAFEVLLSNETLACAVETLDLSDNRLSYIPMQWLSALPKLCKLSLRGNYIETFDLMQFFLHTPTITYIDMRDNELAQLLEAENAAAAHEQYKNELTLRIRIDRNPWNCMWLLNFAHEHPEKFRIFLYEKFISQINVNGLACQPAEKRSTESLIKPTNDQTTLHADTEHFNDNDAKVVNVSNLTLVVGNPWEFKRNQRTEALIIVFMLPLGIALLFLLLYMWIYCQKVFHLSYYRSIPFIGRSAMGRAFTSRSAERFDVIRHLPPTNSAVTFAHETAMDNNNEDYEIPLDGVTSACNCNHIAVDACGSMTDLNSKCHKTHHITYEPLPTERPYKIYEEIIEIDNVNDCDGGHGDSVVTDVDIKSDVQPSVASTLQHPFYDHLRFADPTILH